MGCLIAEIASLVFGIITLATGKFTLTRNKVVRGTAARIVGLLLVLILPCAFGIAFLVAIILAAQGRLPDVKNPPAALFLIEPITFILLFGAAMIVAFTNAGAPAKKRPGYELDDLEEDDEFEHRLERKRRSPDDRLPE